DVLANHVKSWDTKPQMKKVIEEDPRPMKLNRQRTREFLNEVKSRKEAILAWHKAFLAFIGGDKWNLPNRWFLIDSKQLNWMGGGPRPEDENQMKKEREELKKQAVEFYGLAKRLADLGGTEAGRLDRRMSEIQEAVLKFNQPEHKPKPFNFSKLFK